ncbi:hypothetical protein G8770_01465 [Aestuariicella hydrocarbonica]|uniref:Uncharacterized protein n=1 Tax=Pseudomaricurvus hydrocarbonicus TaxID=1470433 RepID=A0A9E5JPH0_9GAMM|nr:hypothetical protein [Aestuariicella hydrocarbonica]NHO64212.1 hypothetical protein [Aestuariicella hydrocarbonica]
MLNSIINSPYLNLFSALVLLSTSLYETIAKLDELTLGVHHGVLVFSIIQLVKVVPEMLEGLKQLNEADELMEESVVS